VINKTISHYKIIEEIGSGGMGIVYKAEDTKLKRTVALKFLPPELLRDNAAKERFTQEAQAAASLNHTNICTIHEIDEHDGQTFIAMEYIEGVSLKDKVAERPLKIEEALDVAIQIGTGLQKAHERGIIHRDVKPANILISTDGVAKIVDFGLAKLSGQTKLTKDGSTLGTVGYMSVEQTRGEEVDRRTDIWSLGVVLYECISGQLPFRGDYEQALQYSIVNEEPEPLTGLRTGIPLELERIVNKALAKIPDERYQHVDEMLVDFKKVQKDLDSKAEDERRPIVAAEKKRARRLTKRIMIPVSVFIVFVLAIFLIRSFLFEEVFGSDPIPIAVLPFENLTGDSEYEIYRKSITSLFINKLEQTKYLQVTTLERLSDLLKQVGKDSLDVVDIDQETGLELCRLDGVTDVITGNVSKIGDMFALDVKVLSVESKQMITSATTEGKGENSLLKQVDQISEEIAEGVGLSQRKIEDIRQPIADITTTSIEAYNFFIRGIAESEKLYLNNAASLFKKAIELDSTFALAHLCYAQTIGPLGYAKACNAAYEKAKKFSYKATQKERLIIEADYARKIERNPQKRITIYQELSKKYPKEKSFHHVLGFYNRNQRQYSEAIKEHKIALELYPDYGPSLNQLGYIYSEIGDYQTAMKYYEQYALAAPNDANPFDSIAELHFRMGQLDEAIAKFKEAIHLKPDFKDSYWRIGYICAFKEEYDEALNWIDQYFAIAPSESERAIARLWKGFYYYWLGNFEKSLIELKNTENLVKDVGNERLIALSKWIKGSIFSSIGDYNRSRREYNNYYTLYKIFPDWEGFLTLYYNLGLGLVDLKEGKIDSVKYRFEIIKSLLPKIDLEVEKYVPIDVNIFYGEILLVEGLNDKVINILKETPSLGIPNMYTYGLIPYNIPFQYDLKARTYIQTGAIDDAIAEYERLTTFDPKSEDRRLIYPKYHYRIAKLYEEKGETGKAIERYKKFLDIWKNADDDLPEKMDAQKRLEKLTGE